MASSAYSRDYRQWLDSGNFERVYGFGSEDIRNAIETKRPDLVASALRDLALCYYTRGVALLLDQSMEGWRDIQCGYMATVYSFRFAWPLASPLAASRKESPDYLVQTVLTLGLARLFAVEYDERILREWLTPRYDLPTMIGKVQGGGPIITSLYETEHDLPADALRRDRRECCKKRDAWPKRPTEFEPFGVLDVELALNYPR